MDITIIAVTLRNDKGDWDTIVAEGHLTLEQAQAIALDDYNEMMEEGHDEIQADDETDEPFEPFSIEEMLEEYNVTIRHTTLVQALRVN